LKANPLLSQANFTLVLSTIYILLLAMFWLTSINDIAKQTLLILFSVNGLFTLLQGLIVAKIKKSLLTAGEITNKIRKLGYLHLISLLVGNIFTFLFSFSLIKKKETVEYVFTYYMLVVQILIIGLSAMNIF